MINTNPAVEPFARAMARVVELLRAALPLAEGQNDPLFDRLTADARAVASEWGMHPQLIACLADEAVYQYEIQKSRAA